MRASLGKLGSIFDDDGTWDPSQVPVNVDYGTGGNQGSGGWSFGDIFNTLTGSFGGAQLPNGSTLVQGADGKMYLRYATGQQVPYVTPGTTSTSSLLSSPLILLLLGGAVLMAVAKR